MKNGNNEGTTELNHNANPVLVATRFCLENITKQIVNNKNIAGIIFFLREKVRIFICYTSYIEIIF